MRGACAVFVLIGCSGERLRVEPAAIDVTVELDAAKPIPLVVTADGVDISGDSQTTFELSGAQLGRVDASGFVSDGRTGGSATLVVVHRDARIELPVHVRIHEDRLVGAAPTDANTRFANAHDVAGSAPIDPADGAVLPPNLGRLDISFSPGAANDLHEVAVVADDDLDVHIYGTTGIPNIDARTVELTAAEWDALVRTRRGGTAEIRARALATAGPADAVATTSHIAVADLPFANQIIFTGKTPTGAPEMWNYDVVRSTTEHYWNGPAMACLGCHVTMSRDGSRFAAGGSDGTNGGGFLIDTKTLTLAVPPSAAVGTWTGAAFGNDNTLVTTNTGTISIRDATTALPRTTITPPTPANQPAISHVGTTLAYVAGPINTVSTQPDTEQLVIHGFDSLTGTLGPAHTLVPAQPSSFVKLPDFSSDDRWIVFMRVAALFRTNGSVFVVRADGSGQPLELAKEMGIAKFATPIVAARSGGSDAEPMTWIVMRSDRPVGGRSQATVGQLWAMAFYPERGVASAPFCLPGQRTDVAVLHQPLALPQP
jgi:hypothetical protein